MSKVTKVKISENYEAVKGGIRKIGERAIQCKGAWSIGKTRKNGSYIKFYSRTIMDKVPEELRVSPNFIYENDSDCITDYRVVDKLTAYRVDNISLFNLLVNISQQLGHEDLS